MKAQAVTSIATLTSITLEPADSGFDRAVLEPLRLSVPVKTPAPAWMKMSLCLKASRRPKVHDTSGSSQVKSPKTWASIRV
jgi:hypothetical protein